MFYKGHVTLAIYCGYLVAAILLQQQNCECDILHCATFLVVQQYCSNRDKLYFLQ